MRKPGYDRAVEMVQSRRFRDIEIARVCGYTRERIRQLRNRLGLPVFAEYPESFRDIRAMRRKGLSDEAIARKLKISGSELEQQCAEFDEVYLRKRPQVADGLRAARPHFGRRPDREIARLSGVPDSRVKAYREALGFCAVRTSNRRPEYPLLVGLLKSCQYTFAEMREKSGYSTSGIQRVKKKLGVRGSKPRMMWVDHPGLPIVARMLRRGGHTCREMAQRSGMNQNQVGGVKRHLRVPPVDSRLRKLIRQHRQRGRTDREIGKRLGFSPSEARGLFFAFESRVLASRHRFGFRDSLRRLRPSLGMVPDSELAARYRTPVDFIRRYRQSLGLSRASERKKHARAEATRSTRRARPGAKRRRS